MNPQERSRGPNIPTVLSFLHPALSDLLELPLAKSKENLIQAVTDVVSKRFFSGQEAE